ncbi:collagen alpha-1(I) chain-like [Antechinus flavipes]|uniref:collagen alpha-1(I) chain-like n=1 Tax=Antechinus flavipes TaxID=38775 RepID=UPI002235E8F0|nr:collagen alpha-1(I) chain-like [Antechinus flavipes]
MVPLPAGEQLGSPGSLGFGPSRVRPKVGPGPPGMGSGPRPLAEGQEEEGPLPGPLEASGLPGQLPAPSLPSARLPNPQGPALLLAGRALGESKAGGRGGSAGRGALCSPGPRLRGGGCAAWARESPQAQGGRARRAPGAPGKEAFLSVGTVQPGPERAPKPRADGPGRARGLPGPQAVPGRARVGRGCWEGSPYSGCQKAPPAYFFPGHGGGGHGEAGEGKGPRGAGPAGWGHSAAWSQGPARPRRPPSPAPGPPPAWPLEASGEHLLVWGLRSGRRGLGVQRGPLGGGGAFPVLPSVRENPGEPQALWAADSNCTGREGRGGSLLRASHLRNDSFGGSGAAVRT